MRIHRLIIIFLIFLALYPVKAHSGSKKTAIQFYLNLIGNESNLSVQNVLSLISNEIINLSESLTTEQKETYKYLTSLKITVETSPTLFLSQNDINQKFKELAILELIVNKNVSKNDLIAEIYTYLDKDNYENFHKLEFTFPSNGETAPGAIYTYLSLTTYLLSLDADDQEIKQNLLKRSYDYLCNAKLRLKSKNKHLVNLVNKINDALKKAR
ncbi:hypothetical protein K9F62_11045 [Desulfovibrio sp. JY]|nr:hypothetical protein K9F62_11045 [Desulfovibrio sp. JY]